MNSREVQKLTCCTYSGTSSTLWKYDPLGENRDNMLWTPPDCSSSGATSAMSRFCQDGAGRDGWSVWLFPFNRGSYERATCAVSWRAGWRPNVELTPTVKCLFCGSQLQVEIMSKHGLLDRLVNFQWRQLAARWRRESPACHWTAYCVHNPIKGFSMRHINYCCTHMLKCISHFWIRLKVRLWFGISGSLLLKTHKTFEDYSERRQLTRGGTMDPIDMWSTRIWK